ncbi:MAG: PHP domain-containing protein [Massiliimalia sp.]|jgi:predicted metal-dependent phosphoesterase TrpH
MKGDLHCHTKLSDGSEGIEEVVAMAKRIGLDFLAITDHDTIASFSRSKILGERYGVQIIPGVEFSCVDKKRGRKVHMLCYLPEKPDRLEGHCIKICKRRYEAGSKMLQKVMHYFPITVEDVTKYSSHSTSLYKQHIMQALMSYSYATRMYGGLYQELFNSKTGRVYESVEYPDVYEVIDLIHQAQGLAVLAHPYEYNSVDLMDELAAAQMIDGIEVYHSRCEQADEDRLIQTAKKYDLVMTGGSDFHGSNSSKPSPLGNRYTPQESLDALFRRKDQRMK